MMHALQPCTLETLPKCGVRHRVGVCSVWAEPMGYFWGRGCDAMSSKLSSVLLGWGGLVYLSVLVCGVGTSQSFWA